MGKLIAQGLDRKKPYRLNDQEALVVMGACAGHMELVIKLKERTAAITSEMSVLTQSVERCGMEVQMHLENMLKVLEVQARLSHMPENHAFESNASPKKRPSTGKPSNLPAVRKENSQNNLTALDLGATNSKGNLMQSARRTDAKPSRSNSLHKVHSCHAHLDMIPRRAGDDGKGHRETPNVLHRSKSMVMQTPGNWKRSEAALSTLLQTRFSKR